MSSRMRCAVVGIGHRAGSWIGPASKQYADRVEIVGLCDPVLRRCEDSIRRHGLLAAKAYDDYGRMLSETKPDAVVVVSPESVHADHIVQALHAGCRVGTEKPLCVTGDDAQRILAAEKDTGREVFMGFNYRFIPLCLKIKELIANDVIGRPVSVDLSWYLDYKGHGASYFRRWHGVMANSGGLLITKATHHFDLVNWWLSDRPAKVYAECSLNFFGRGKSQYVGERCSTCPHAEVCEMFSRRTAERKSQELGYQVSNVFDYAGDQCVFRDEIDIYDTHSLTVRYRGGATMNYTLNASVPFEGWNLAINGTRGRLESSITDAKPSPGWQKRHALIQFGPGISLLDKSKYYVADWPAEYKIHVMPHYEVAYELAIPNVAEGHGGGDQRIMEGFFGSGVPADDPLGTFATAIDGARSLAVGAAANLSAAQGRPIEIDEVLGPWA